MGFFEELNTIGYLAIGTKPEWNDVTTYTGAPTGNASGLALNNTPRCRVFVAARETASLRTARYTIDTADLTLTTYTVTIDGTPVAYDASSELPADLAALVAGIAAAIEADGTATLVVDAITDPDDPNSVLITGKAEASFSFDGSVSGGTGAISMTADADGFSLRLWTTPGGVIRSNSDGNEHRWVVRNGWTFTAQDYRGFDQPFDVAGCDRAYVEIYDVVGNVSDGATVTPVLAGVALGPSVTLGS